MYMEWVATTMAYIRRAAQALLPHRVLQALLPQADRHNSHRVLHNQELQPFRLNIDVQLGTLDCNYRNSSSHYWFNIYCAAN